MGVSLDTQLAMMKVSHFLFPPHFISFNCGSVHDSMLMEHTNEMCTPRELVCCVGGMGYGRMWIRFIHSSCVSERDQETLLEITYPYDTQTQTHTKDILVHTTVFQTKDGSNAHTCPMLTFCSTLPYINRFQKELWWWPVQQNSFAPWCYRYH